MACHRVQGFDKYIKKKALDPLVSYIPVLLIASEQLEYVQLAASDLGCEETRSLLRKGAFVGLRDNIRAVGEYSTEICGKETAQVRVKRVFASLEALDGALLVVRSSFESYCLCVCDALVCWARYTGPAEEQMMCKQLQFKCTACGKRA